MTKMWFYGPLWLPSEQHCSATEVKTVMHDLVLVSALLADVTLAIVNALKRKWWTAVLGGPLFRAVGAFRLAKPGSWWDAHRSSPAQRVRSAGRFPTRVPSAAPGVAEA